MNKPSGRALGEEDLDEFDYFNYEKNYTNQDYYLGNGHGGFQTSDFGVRSLLSYKTLPWKR